MLENIYLSITFVGSEYAAACSKERCQFEKEDLMRLLSDQESQIQEAKEAHAAVAMMLADAQHDLKILHFHLQLIDGE